MMLMNGSGDKSKRGVGLSTVGGLVTATSLLLDKAGVDASQFVLDVQFLGLSVALMRIAMGIGRTIYHPAISRTTW